MKQTCLHFLMLLCISLPATARVDANATYINRLSFIENKGQVKDQNSAPRSDIQFSLRAASGLRVFIGNGVIHYQFSKSISSPSVSQHKNGNVYLPADDVPQPVEMYRMDVELIGADNNAEVITLQPESYYENHIAAGADGSDITAHSFGKVIYKNVYPHIDWVLYIKDGGLKHEFIVGAGGNTNDIKLRYRGASSLRLSNSGDLIATTPMGTVTENAPYSYDAHNTPVSSRFVLAGNILSYQVAPHSGVLTIDPSLLWATYYGSSADDVVFRIALNSTGDTYTTGITNSVTGMATSGAYQTIEGGNDDAFIVKHDNAGNLLWATYYGGTGNDRGWEPGVDASGNVYICGTTTSTAGISTTGCFQPYPGGLSDGFIAKFNSAGARIWATYFGGSGWETAEGIAFDPFGNIYLVGQTSSVSGIASAGAYQPANGGGDDAFIAKFTSAGVRIWSTYYGGPNDDEFYCALTDASGDVYLGGAGTSPSAISSPGAYQTAYGGGVKDAIFAKFSSTGSRLWSTYFGGSGDEYCTDICTDLAGDIYWVGQTSSSTAIATPGAHQTVWGGGEDGYIAKFSPSGAIIWSTYYGGSNGEIVNGITSNAAGDIFFGGSSYSTSGIATPGAMQTTPVGGSDMYYGQMTSAGTLLYASYYGAPADESTYSVINDGSGNVYISGTTNSSSGLASPGAWQTVYGGGPRDGFLVKINHCMVPVVAPVTGTSTVCATSTTTLSDATAGGVWTSANPSVATVSASGVVSGVAGGTALISYGVSNSCGTGYATFVADVTPLPVVAAVTGTSSVCVGGSVTFGCVTSSGVWSSGTPAVASVSSGGAVLGLSAGTSTISYTVTNVCGSTSSTRVVTVNSGPAVAPITGALSVCTGSTIVLNSATAGGTWSSSDVSVGTVSPFGSDCFVTGVATGTTTISYTVTNACGSTTVTYVVSVTPAPIVAPIAGASSICIGSSVTLSCSTPGGSWSSLSPGIATAAVGGIITGMSTGTAIIRYTVTGVCGTAFASAIVTVAPLPVVAPVTGVFAVCVGSSVTLSSSTPGGSWSSAAPAIATAAVGGVVTGIAPGTAAIMYTVSGSCGTTVVSANVTVSGLPVVAPITGTVNVCPGDTIMLSNATPGGSWGSSAMAVATVSSAGIVSGIVTGTTVIDYTVTNSCGATAVSHTVNVLPASACVSATGTVALVKPIFAAWPSPNRGAFTARLDQAVNEDITVSVADIAGRKVKEIAGQANMAMPVTIEVPGIYLLSVSTSTGRYVIKVMVE